MLAGLLVSTMLCCSAAAIAEETAIDFSSYTLDELAAIQNDLNAELQERLSPFDADMIYRGKYVVGKDIQPGLYIFICAESTIGLDTPRGEIVVYAFDESGSKEETVFSADRLKAGDGVAVSLDAGMLLEIEYCSGTMRLSKQNWTVGSGE